MPETQVILTGLSFGEAPRWHDGRLWVADWGEQQIIVVTPEGKRESSIQVDFPSLPLCFDFSPAGQLLIVSAYDGRILRREADGSLSLHADISAFARPGIPWNEIVVDGRSNAYINNLGFRFPAEAFAPGTIVLLTSDGEMRQVADGLAFPNGMAVTPDNATLIVAESHANCLTAFDIAEDGHLTNRRIWANTGDDHPDGICLDAEGAIWYADVGNRRCVRVREGGEVLQTIELDRGCFSCALGGADRKTLFIVAKEWNWNGESMAEEERTGQVIAVQVAVPGV